MNRLLICGAALGLISVIMGALGDHAFHLTPEKADSLETAIHYNMIYAVLIVALSIAPKERKFHTPAIVFIIGTVLFSSGIYASLMSGIQEITYLTPIGGLTIMLGWVSLMHKASINKS